MVCQYPGCVNIGVHSCSVCGKLVCGKHAPIADIYPKCTTCWQAEVQAKAKKEEEGMKLANKGCLIVLLGIAAMGLGGYLIWAGHGRELSLSGAIVGLVGFIVVCIGLGMFFTGAPG
jgi:hypothetical protein